MGFKPVTYQGASGDEGKVQTFSVDAAHTTLLAIGDCVTPTGTANTDGIMGVDASAAGELIEGTIVGVEVDPANLTNTGLPALTAGLIRVQTDPFQVYEVPGENGPFVLTDVGQNVDIVANVATRSGGITRGNMTANRTGIGTATAQFRVIGLKDGDVTTDQIVLVRPVEFTKQSATGI